MRALQRVFGAKAGPFWSRGAMRVSNVCVVTCAMLVVLAVQAAAEPPEYPVKKEPAEEISFLERLKRDVPPLKNPLGDRLPMICWDAVGTEPREPEVYRALLERGLTQHIPMDAKMIPTAKALQEAGSPVIMMRGKAGPWPYNQAPGWAHQYEEGYEPQVPERWWPSWKACPAVFEGWRVNADRVRETLRRFKEAGVTVDAVWMDWETEPSSSRGKEGWENVRHCKRCKETLPPEVLDDPALWYDYCRRLHAQLIGTYLAAPVREVFPACSITNWMLVCSTKDRPVLGWRNDKVPPIVPSMVTATNPVAYGNDVFWQFWGEEWPLDRRHVDRFYMHLLLREVSDDAANRLIYAPEMDCVPWVDRWCPDVGDSKIPMVSREAYREALRHIWLRGADSLQIFNPSRKGYEDIVFAEIADAVAVCDELLAYARFLDGGEILCCDVPGVQHDGVLWSGLRLTNEAVVRVINQGEGTAMEKMEPWDGVAVELEAPSEGATYILTREEGAVRAQRQ